MGTLCVDDAAYGCPVAQIEDASTADHDFRAAVGELAHRAAVLESVTAILMWGLVGVEQKVGRRVLPNAMDRMLPVISRELEFRVSDLELRRRVSDWVGEVRTTWQDRSRIIHSVWIYDAAENRFNRLTLKPLTGEPLEHTTTAAVLAIGNAARDLAERRFGAFISDVTASAPGPWSAGPSLPDAAEAGAGAIKWRA
jgi:hypothetical protein